MSNWRDFFISGCIFAVVIVLSILVYIYSKDECPMGTMPCSSGGICIPHKSVCNKQYDCPEGEDEDEILCADLYGSTHLLEVILNTSLEESLAITKMANLCDIDEYPESCVCGYRTRIYCNDAQFTKIPQNISTTVTYLGLQNNSITVLSMKSLKRYNLTLLYLEDNDIIYIAPNTFQQQKHLKKLFLMNNNLTKLDYGVFNGLLTLEWLLLDNNNLKNIDLAVFETVTEVQWLDLSYNSLEFKENETFPDLPMLLELYLNNNRIKQIGRNIFGTLLQLRLLNLKSNQIKMIEPKAFQNLRKLEELDLFDNRLKILSDEIFASQGKLLKLSLGNNPVKYLPKELFVNLRKLVSLNLEEIEIRNIDTDMFKGLVGLKSIYLKSYRYCAYAPTVPRCSPLSDELCWKKHCKITCLTPDRGEAFRNILLELGKRLLDQRLQLELDFPLEFRLTATFTVTAGQIDLSMLYCISLDFEKLYPTASLQFFQSWDEFFHRILNRKTEELSDLVGLQCKEDYLSSSFESEGISSTTQLLFKPIFRYSIWIMSFITIAGNTLVLFGRFIFKDKNKNLSVVIKNLAVSDCLMGIYLFIIAYHDIKFRDSYNIQASQWMSSWSCALTGIVGMISLEVSVMVLVFLSVDRYFVITMPYRRFGVLNVKETWRVLLCIWCFGIAISVLPALGFISSTKFYGINGLCLPLYIDDPFLIGWEYSALIFFGINAPGLIIIIFAYAGMFIDIKKTRNATTAPTDDSQFAIKFIFIVLANVACWLPIIVAKAIVCFQVDITADVYGWLTVFILPINSCLNPILYTFTTRKYRRRLVSVPSCIKKLTSSISNANVNQATEAIFNITTKNTKS